MNRRPPAALLACLLTVLLVAACSGGGPGPADGSGTGGSGTGGSGTGGSAGELTVLAGSELQDIQPLLPDLTRATGVTLRLSYTGTLDGADAITRGTAQADAAWFASDRYLRLLPNGATSVAARSSIMLSPVVFGVRRSLARQFGWTGNPNVTWADIAAKVAAGQLSYAMTNPAASNSGFSALVGVAAALAGTPDALRPQDIRPAQLTSFFSGQALTAGSSGFLTDAYARSQDTLGGMINYESVLLALNAGHRLREPLELIYPRDGIVTSDYPLLLLRPDKRDLYDRVVSWLRLPRTQHRLQTATSRRPALPGVALDARFPTRTLTELPFPASRQVADQLLSAYLDRFRRPSHAIFLLDVSGSMAGSRIAALQAALRGLTGADDTLSGRFARFRGREKITMITFAGRANDPVDFAVNDPRPGSADLAGVNTFVDGLRLQDGTAIYSALEAGYRAAGAAVEADPGYLTSIVLMTDGENNSGISAADFRSSYQRLPAAARAVRTFTIAFGEADPAALRDISADTGGAVFDARTSSLADAFKDIRGYQ
ncbi:VWA domain-containing protein [Frankia sp. KB5]|uniref:vWA domain-containing protein n=1 Tax=Frankia sp. KB5 TaxID=683318 RepID=UPI000A120BAC|nr:VWA domain-containing protein [Frankia sp. KB5]ORT46661.1 hypothetical protein KBI5_23980 [Frankia sp. KB5]